MDVDEVPGGSGLLFPPVSVDIFYRVCELTDHSVSKRTVGTVQFEVFGHAVARGESVTSSIWTTLSPVTVTSYPQ